ncbi:hypothetical protein CP880_09285 [Cutibacterium namnetense]|uniref:Uncharacterized protein n=1 Tax=Cutibacterium namnetense TaxID=1574624 RepID=A0ABX9I9D4_9ACTN|nr:hypothetical protein CP880_09285 [Cutibacterium namnetense]TKW73174.1 MAG: hypothetical protein DI580_00680 [Cutibacterium acnes]
MCGNSCSETPGTKPGKLRVSTDTTWGHRPRTRVEPSADKRGHRTDRSSREYATGRQIDASRDESHLITTRPLSRM